MTRLRRALLEFWAMLALALVAGFLGPFGTYANGDFLARVGSWALLLAGAYILIRPAILAWEWVAHATRLPRNAIVMSGVVLSSVPMTFLWRFGGFEQTRALGGFSGLWPFTLLCSLAVMMIAGWAKRADEHLLANYDANTRYGPSAAPEIDSGPQASPKIGAPGRPRLYARLGLDFHGDVLALESEDHYVRVHGLRHSKLILIRLRDAIAEMDGHPGEQTHRSWWVARDAVTKVANDGRNREIVLPNGVRSPVARDSVDRLQRVGFLPA